MLRRCPKPTMKMSSDGWSSARWRIGEERAMRTQTTRQFRVRRQGGLMRVLSAAVFLALVVMPLTDIGVSAKDNIKIDPVILQDQPVVDPGTVVDPPPVDTPTPEPTIPVLQQVPADGGRLDDPVIKDPGTEVNDLYINPILCPSDLDLAAVDYYGLAANCNLGYADGWELIVMDSQSNWWVHNVINGGGAGQSGLPNDDYYISFTHPSGGY